MDILIAFALVALLFLILASGLWIGLTLLAVAYIGMELFTQRPVGDAMALTIWGATSSWTLTTLPMFLWMGEILFRTRVAERMFKALAPWLNHVPGRLLHVNVMSSTIFAAVSGSSAATCATIGRMVIPELQKRGYPDQMVVGTLAGSASLGLLIPPSIIMIVYGVAADVSIVKLFAAGVIPGILLALIFAGYIAFWSLRHPEQIPAADSEISLKEKLKATLGLLPIFALITVVMGSIYFGIATATEAAIIGVIGAFGVAIIERSLSWRVFIEGLQAAVRVYAMIGLILAAAAFLTLAMGYMGLPRHLAEFIASLQLSQFALTLALTAFFLVLGCFLDGISMVVLTIAVLLPTITAAGFDLIWFGVFIVIVVEIAQITPPVGFNLFVLQGLTKREISWLARASLPMFCLMIAFIMLIYFVPGIVTWLPSRM